MPLLTYQDRSVFFIHIPKTGGSSMYLGGLESQGIQARFFGNAAPCTRQHYHIKLLEKFFPDYKNHHPFTIIRDPWSRTCSEFVWVFRNTRDWDHFDGWLLRHLKAHRSKPYLLDNHLRPQVDFVAPGVEVFLQHRHWEAEQFVSDRLGHEFDFSGREKSYQYDRPGISILSTETKTLWENLYAQDLELFDRLK